MTAFWEYVGRYCMDQHQHCQHALCSAGLADGNTTVAATGESFFDVSMSELSHVLLPRLEPKLPKFDKRSPEWLHKQRASWLEDQKHWLHCLLSPAACQLMPWKHIAGAAVEQGNIQDQRVEVMLQSSLACNATYYFSASRPWPAL